MGIRRAWRLKAQADVQRVWREGSSHAHPLLILRVRPNGLAETRVAFVVSKKIGKAVERNYAKRRLREVMRRLYPRLQLGYDLVLIVRPPLVTANLDQVRAALQSLLERARLMADGEQLEKRS